MLSESGGGYFVAVVAALTAFRTSKLTRDSIVENEGEDKFWEGK